MEIRTKEVIISLAATLSVAAFLSACGDDITKISSYDIQSVASFKKLGKCTSKNEGDLVFVKDSAAVYLCSDSVWKVMDVSDDEEVQDGSNGKNGTSCTVSALKDGSGYDVLCGGSKVGTLLNGDDGKKGDKGDKGDKGSNGDKGADGDAGTTCSTKALKNGSGSELSCDGEVVGTIKNGKNGTQGDTGATCTTEALKDGSGFELSCDGKVVGTIKNGTTASAACSFDDDGEGTVLVKCGDDRNGVKLFKAQCGTEPYDPSKSVCLEGEDYSDIPIRVVVPLCGSKPYNPGDPNDDKNIVNFVISSSSKQTCRDGVVYEKCGDGEYNIETQFCEKGKAYNLCNGGEPYDVEQFFCKDDILYGTCGDKPYNIFEQMCSEQNKILNNCKNSSSYYDPDLEFCDENNEVKKLCNGKTFKPTEFCGSDNKIHDRCGEELKDYDIETEVCKDGKVLTKCGKDSYDPATHFCGKNNQITPRCGDDHKDYDIEIETCKDGKVLTKCGKDGYNPATHFCGSNNQITLRCGEELKDYDTETEVCKDGKVLTKCGKDSYDSQTHVCKIDKVLKKCGDKGDGYDPATQVCDEENGNVLTKCGEAGYDPATHFCGTNNQITLRCGEQLEDYDLETQKCEEGKVLTQCGETYYYPPEQKCVNNKVEDRYFCGEGDNKKEYDKTKQFCDTRDNHVYKFIHFYNEQTKKPYYPVYWIAEDVTYYSNNVGYRLNWFTWETAQSACPKGWHLPTKKEFELLIYKAGGSDIAGKNLKSIEGWSTASEALDRYGFSATPSGYDFEKIAIGDGFGTELGLWWSSTDEGDSVYVLEMHNNSDAATVKLWLKKSLMETDMNYSVRCIWVGRSTKDTP